MYFKNDVYVYFIMILFHLHYIEWKIEQDEPIRLLNFISLSAFIF